MASNELAGSDRNRAILLVTDGDISSLDEEQRHQLDNVAADIGKDGIPVYVLGVGSVEGDAIPLADGGWLSRQGRPVISRMDVKQLQSVADITGGRFSLVYDDDSDWISLYEQGMAAMMERLRGEADTGNVIWHELYPLALLPAMLLLMISLLPYRLQLPQLSQSLPLIMLVLLISSLTPGALFAADREQDAYAAYLGKDYQNAAELYGRLSSYAGRLGEASSQYRLGNYQVAIRQYSQSLLLAETDEQRAMSLYNLGNSYFKTGDYANAVVAYSDALRYQPGHAEAATNLNFTTELVQIIARRQAVSGRSNRMGAGARSNRAEPGIDISQAGAVSIDESDNSEKTDETTPELPGQEQATIEELVEKGMEHIRLAADNATDIQHSKRRQRELSLSTARLHMQSLNDRQAVLWKRVFEMELGFPGSLKEPRQLQGTPPW
jgi:tetratricopeptide (TPR) repeat protein